MSYMLRCLFVFDDGEVIHDETVVSDDDSVFRIEKGMVMFNKHGRLILEFDPPLVAEIAPE